MDETKHILSSPTNVKRLQKRVKEQKEGSEDNFFGIWIDKNQDVDVYIRGMRHVVSNKNRHDYEHRER